VEEQIEIAMQKAGLFNVPLEEVKIQKFTVERYREKE